MRSFKGGVGLWLFERNQTILKWNRYVINLVSFAVFALMIARYGFNYEKDLTHFWIIAIRSLYSFYAFHFIFRLVLARNRLQFIADQWFEATLFTLILANAISYFVFSVSQLQKVIPLEHTLYEFVLLLLLLILAFTEFVKSLNFIISKKIKPTTLFIGSYIILIVVGTGLIMLPGFNVNRTFLDFYDAFFISTSATCITGLSTLTVVEVFNFKGQVLLLILFQLGGIGILTFASFFATFIKKGLGIKHQILMNELFDSDSLSGSFSLLKRILILLFGIELLGAVAMYFLWGDYAFESEGQRIFYTVFHSISAFCNAGFSLFPEGIETTGVRNLYLLHWVIILLAFSGSLGFPTLRDIFSPRRLRERIRLPWKGWKTSTQISLYTGFALLILGAIAYYVLWIRHLEPYNKGIAAVTLSLFQSVNLRSSGMSALDLSTLPTPLIMASMFLMFVGGGSSSLAGGIKTSTFIVAVAAIISTIRGRKEATLGRRTISNDLIYRAFAVILFSGNFTLLVITILTFTDPNIPFLKLAFEAVSAVGNTGASMGITGELSNAGKLIISFAMFSGRVGLLTLAFALSSKEKPNTVRYPHTHIIIG